MEYTITTLKNKLVCKKNENQTLKIQWTYLITMAY